MELNKIYNEDCLEGMKRNRIKRKIIFTFLVAVHIGCIIVLKDYPFWVVFNATFAIIDLAQLGIEFV